MPPGFNFTINVIYLAKFCRSLNYSNIIQRFPNENNADILNQATYFANIHGFVTGNNSSNVAEL